MSCVGRGLITGLVIISRLLLAPFVAPLFSNYVASHRIQTHLLISSAALLKRQMKSPKLAVVCSRCAKQHVSDLHLQHRAPRPCHHSSAASFSRQIFRSLTFRCSSPCNSQAFAAICLPASTARAREGCPRPLSPHECCQCSM